MCDIIDLNFSEDSDNDYKITGKLKSTESIEIIDEWALVYTPTGNAKKKSAKVVTPKICKFLFDSLKFPSILIIGKFPENMVYDLKASLSSLSWRLTIYFIVTSKKHKDMMSLKEVAHNCHSALARFNKIKTSKKKIVGVTSCKLSHSSLLPKDDLMSIIIALSSQKVLKKKQQILKMKTRKARFNEYGNDDDRLKMSSKWSHATVKHIKVDLKVSFPQLLAKF